MGNYWIKRLISAVVVIWAVSTIVFFVTMASGDPAVLMLPPDASEKDIELFRSAHGLNDPILVQYVRFLGNSLRGDFGVSIQHGTSAFSLALSRLPATVQLSLLGFAVALGISIPVGIFAALKHGTPIDSLAMGLAFVGQSVPNFWLGIMLINVFAVGFMWLPPFGRGDWRHFILPVATVASQLIPYLTRCTRSSMIEVLSEDYVRTAKAKGVPWRSLVFKHALRNAMLPIVTVSGLQLGYLLSGAVVIETVFAWPGIGRLAVQAILNRDFPVIQSTVFIVAILVIACNTIADLLYASFDPRISIK